MCTALSIGYGVHYFGRNLDLDCSYGEQVCVMPRNFPLHFRKMGQMPAHYAMIGMAFATEALPLYYEAANEHGLCMAGLNFPKSAVYFPEKPGKDNVTPFEFIPWILGQCKTVEETRLLLEKLNLVDIAFSPQMPLSPLHWIIADGKQSLVVESMADGLHVYENPVGVMSNEPPFDYQLFNLNNYRGLSPSTPKNQWNTDLGVYCQGLGGMGLPGDVSSMSRFVRLAFCARNAPFSEIEMEDVSQFFHLLGAVSMPRGMCLTDAGPWDITVYSCCMNATRGLYYYTTYDNSRITCVDLHKSDLEGREVTVYPLRTPADIYYE